MEAPAVTEFFSLNDSPAKPANADDTVRDHYGFMVPADYHELYRVYSPIWEQEETEREAHWCQFLIELAHLNADDGKFASIEDLCADYLQDAVTIARNEQGPPSPHRQKLDALVQGGIPFTIRGSVWTVFLDTSVRKQRNYYNDLVKRCLGDLQYRGNLELDEIRQQAALASQALQDAAALHGLPGYAAVTEKALSTWRSNSKVWLTQIEKDLPRTFPGLTLMEVSGRPALRRVLAAYSLHNSRVGYCQGLNFVAGTLLLFLDEEDAFWCLCALLEDILKGYYDVDMMAMQVDQRVFKRLVSEHFPKLAAHLGGLGADVSCVFVQWFLCVFVNFLPIEACLRVWDALFYYRSPTVLFKTALALLEVFDPALSCCTDVLDALDLLQTMAPLTYDSNRLISHAFGPAFDGVTDTRLATLRREYREEVEAEAAALAEELAWESSTASGATAGGGSGAAVITHQAASNASASSQTGTQQAPAPQQSSSRISVLKMIARGMKEKFAGVGVGGSGAPGGGGNSAMVAFNGSGANSVERAASPVPDATLAAAITSVALGSGGGGGGSAAGPVAADGGTEEPLLIRSSQPLDACGVDVDSEDYHRLNGDDGFQYEQVGYVAPSDLSSETAGRGVNSLELLSCSPPRGPRPPLLPESPYFHGDGASLSGATAISSAAAAGNASGIQVHEQQQQLHSTGTAAPSIALQPTRGAAGSAEGGDHGVLGGNTAPAPLQPTSCGNDPLEQLMEVARGITSASALEPAAPAPAAVAAGDYGGCGDGARFLRRSSDSSFRWHETPKWTSFRIYSGSSATVAGTPQESSLNTASAVTPMGTLPAAAAIRTPLVLGDALTGSSEPPVGPMSPHVLMLAAERSQSLGVHLRTGNKEDDDVDRGPALTAGGSSAATVEVLPQRMELRGGGGTVDGSATTSDFSQVQAADQARRAQGSKRRCSKAASMAWDIALAPLKLRQQMQQHQHNQKRQSPPLQQQQNHPSMQKQQQQQHQHHQQQHHQQQREHQPSLPPQPGTALDAGNGGWATAPGPHPRCMPHGSEATVQNPHAAAARSLVATAAGSDGQQHLHQHPHHLSYHLNHHANQHLHTAAIGPRPHLPGGGGGAGVTSPLHAPADSSVASTCSVLLLDELKEHSPAEARDEWVIMTAPSEGLSLMPSSSPLQNCHGQHGLSYGHVPQVGTVTITATGVPAHSLIPQDGNGVGGAGAADGGGGGGAGSKSTFGHFGQPAPQQYQGPLPPGLYNTSHNNGGSGIVGGGSGAMTSSAYQGGDAGSAAGGGGGGGAATTASMRGGEEAAGIVEGWEVPAVGGSGSVAGAPGAPTGSTDWRSAVDGAGPPVQEMRESFGVEDLLRQQSALSIRLQRLKQPSPPLAPAADTTTRTAATATTTAATTAATAAVAAPSGWSFPSDCGAGESVDGTLTRPIAVAGASSSGNSDVASARPPAVTEGPKGNDTGSRSCQSFRELSPSLDRLVQLQRLLEDLAATLTAPSPPNVATAAAMGTSSAPGVPAAAVLPAPSIAAAAGGNGSAFLPDGLLSLPLPYTAAATAQTPAVTPFDQLIVGPGGQVRLQSVAAAPVAPPVLRGAAGLSAANGPSAAIAPAALTEVAHVPAVQQQQQQQELLQKASGLCSVLRGDLSSGIQREAEASALLEQYDVLSEVLAARLDELVQQLAEKQYTIDKLSNKLDQTMQKYAAQDTALADKDFAIKHLQFQLQAGHGMAAAVGGGGGPPVSGLSSALGLSGATATTPLGHVVGATNVMSTRGTPGSTPAGAGGGVFSLVPTGGVYSLLGSGGAAAAAGAAAPRHSSPPRGVNQSLLWQFGKNLKAKFGGRDDQQDG
ncbi:hypothetical protein Vretifemale_12097 [Volvox reticuliferus]|uniref:Rab-GAP TBC domain-containing protein n=3 Tax=Volvox reticuliferus TaxID=1737510 RepID=A0A8J4FP66_9CHLO|nr:hypothetical protein Vretifemale_12097 [Volvox reticuliferus]